MTAAYLACLALGYLIGSLSVSILISKYIFHQDVRTLGSGNAGAANAARTLGAGVGLLTLLGDFLKGIISMLLGSWLGGTTGACHCGRGLHDRALLSHLLWLQRRKGRGNGGSGRADA